MRYVISWLIIISVSCLLLNAGFTFNAIAASSHNPILTTAPVADPHLIKVDGTYYLYGTYLDNSLLGGSDHYALYSSPDLENWTKENDLFRQDSTRVWAPDVFLDPTDNRFYLYYSLDMNIGVAVADAPTGPFEDLGILIESAIDAHMFYDNGQYYLYYSSVDATSEFALILQFIQSFFSSEIEKPRENILVQPMANATELEGEAILLLEPTDSWEKGLMLDVNEGVWMFKNQGTYYLMYSGNETLFHDYAIGYATSDSPLGPFTKYEGNPIVKTSKVTSHNRGVISPGHHSVLTEDDGTHWIIYHQKRSLFNIGFSNRYVCMDQLEVNADGSIAIDATPMGAF